MIHAALPDLVAALPPRRRLFGLDLGAKTIGIAIGDPGHRVASPLIVLARGKFSADAKTLFDLMAAREAGGLVIGLPRNMDGSEGRACQSARQFAANLLTLRDLPITFWDERLSSLAVERAMIAADLSRAKRAARIDAAAAAFILQGALDSLERAP